MARQEHDREDLLAEATALVERAELLVGGWPEEVVAGFRRDGSLSLYFGQDVAYHFNRLGQLRRAYLDGLLYKTERRRLVSLKRERRADQVALLRHDLSDDETQAFLARLSQRLEGLRHAAAQGRTETRREVPSGSGVVRRLLAWLEARPRPIELAPAARLR